MKKIILFFVTLLALAALPACENIKRSETPSGTERPVADEITIPSLVTTAPEEAVTENTSQSEVANAERYDHDKIVEAFHSGDPSKLSDLDKSIYEAAVSAYESFYSEDLSQVDLMLAAHDHLTLSAHYDLAELEIIPHISEHADDPYGALVLKNAICMGYTTAYKLFLDFMGIENILISGEALGEDHAWNMVKTDGRWYHIDCTWDDYVPDYDDRPAVHSYFMVDDKIMANEHIWDRNNSPIADDNTKNYFVTHGLYAETTDDINRMIREAAEKKLPECEIMASKKAFDPILIKKPKGAKIYNIWETEFEDHYLLIIKLDYGDGRWR